MRISKDFPKDGVVVGVDLGGTNMQIGVVNAEGRVVGRCKRKTKAHEGRDTVIDRVVEGIARALEDARTPRERLVGVGVGAPSAVDFDKGLVIKAGNLGWENVPLRDILQKKLACRVALDNDVNVAAWGEAQLGAVRGRTDVLAVWVGTGVGSGLVLNGSVWRGPRHTAGEIGHVVLFPGGQPGMMTVEDVCSRTGIVNALRRLLPMYPESALHKLVAEKADETGSIGSSTIARAYEKDDELATKVVNKSAELLGVAIANIVTMLSIDCVVLGGGVTEALGEPYVGRVRKSFERTVFPSILRKTDIVASTLNDDAGMLGAAMLVA
ncbi:MAG: ROK family protein [Planctomycetaceae bacterium]|nr:ROK family protein [Planctomycetaceae bacterium]